METEFDPGQKQYSLGIDPGLAVAALTVISYVHEPTPAWKIEESILFTTTSAESLGRRLLKLSAAVASMCHKYKLQSACCEGVSVNSTNLPYSLGAAHGAICATLEQTGVPLYRVSPLELKKFCAGVAQASKEKVRSGLVDAFGFDFSGLDEFDHSDAAGLGVIALSKALSILFKSRAKLEVLKKVVYYHNFNTSAG